MKWQKRSIAVLVTRRGVTAQERRASREHVRHSEPVEVAAVTNGHFAVHKYLGGPARGWTITHLGTGRSICHARTQKSAKDVAETIAPMTDWQQFDGTTTGVPFSSACPAVYAVLCNLRRDGTIILG